MEVRCCQNCMYAGPLEVPCCGVTALVCANRAQCPGRLTVVECEGECRNFRAKRRVPARPKPAVAPKRSAGTKTEAVPRLVEPPDEDICYIPLTQGQVAMIDAADYERVKPYKWYASFIRGKFYAHTHCGGKKISMHRLLMDTPKGMVVDHINGNPLNNCRCNMRNCTQAQNGCNRGPNPGSECPGVRFCEATGLWCACVWKDGRENNAGWFADKDEAIRARDHKAVEVFGEFAWLNRPQEARTDTSPGHIRRAGGAEDAGLRGECQCSLCPLNRGSWRGLSLVTKLGTLVTAMVCAVALARRRMPLRSPFHSVLGGRCAVLGMVQGRVAAFETTTRLRHAVGEHGPRIRIPSRWATATARGPPCRS